jgi:hypothetical protein
VGLERGPLSLVIRIEELLGRKSSGSGPENREYGRGVPLYWPRDTLYPQNLALISPTLAVARSVLFASGLRPRSSFEPDLIYRGCSIVSNKFQYSSIIPYIVIRKQRSNANMYSREL